MSANSASITPEIEQVWVTQQGRTQEHPFLGLFTWVGLGAKCPRHSGWEQSRYGLTVHRHFPSVILFDAVPTGLDSGRELELDGCAVADDLLTDMSELKNVKYEKSSKLR